MRLPNGLQIFHELVCVGWASRSRGRFPTACYRDLQHFAVELLSKREPRRRKTACRCLFARKTNTAKIGYSQTHSPKIISVGERR